MSDWPEDPDAEPARDEHRARVERHMAGLRELSELGMELARALARRGMEQAAAREDGALEAERSFSRVTRAVRLTMALEARLSEGLLRKTPPGQGPEDGYWVPKGTFDGAAQRFRERLARLAAAASPGGAMGEDEASEDGDEVEPREREDRERLVETEGDGDFSDGWAGVVGDATRNGGSRRPRASFETAASRPPQDDEGGGPHAHGHESDEGRGSQENRHGEERPGGTRLEPRAGSEAGQRQTRGP